MTPTWAGIIDGFIAGMVASAVAHLTVRRQLRSNPSRFRGQIGFIGVPGEQGPPGPQGIRGENGLPCLCRCCDG